jgi:hypothetical protein
VRVRLVGNGEDTSEVRFACYIERARFDLSGMFSFAWVWRVEVQFVVGLIK